MKSDNPVAIKPIVSSDHKFLYLLLANRDSIANISHKKMPTYKEHIKFVTSKPYVKWYIIYYKRKKSGSIYLTKQNEIGISIKKQMQNMGIGGAALELLINKNPRDRYLANVNPKNTKSINFFKKNRFTLIQQTYELINTDA
mgnify:CR=1 FL=1